VLTWHAERSDETFRVMAISPGDSFLCTMGGSGTQMSTSSTWRPVSCVRFSSALRMECRTRLILIGWQTGRTHRWLPGAEASSGTRTAAPVCGSTKVRYGNRLSVSCFLHRWTWPRAWESSRCSLVECRLWRDSRPMAFSPSLKAGPKQRRVGYGRDTAADL